MQLTERQRRFVEEYPKDFCATQAAIRAGYSAKTAKQIGHENLTKPDIRQALSEFVRQAKACAEKQHQQAIADQAQVLAELNRVGFFSLGRLLRFTSSGEPIVDLSLATEEELAALASVEVENVKEGPGDNSRDIRRVSIRAHDKLRALALLSRHLGLLADETEVQAELGIAERLQAARLRALGTPPVRAALWG